MENGKPMLVKNGTHYDPGVLGSGLVQVVEDNPEALEHAEAFRNRNILGLALSAGGAAFALGGATVLAYSAARTGGPSDVAALTSGTVMLSGIGLMMASTFVLMSAPPRFYDAINVYNDAVAPAPPWPMVPPGYRAPPPGAVAPLAQPPAP